MEGALEKFIEALKEDGEIREALIGLLDAMKENQLASAEHKRSLAAWRRSSFPRRLD